MPTEYSLDCNSSLHSSAVSEQSLLCARTVQHDKRSFYFTTKLYEQCHSLDINEIRISNRLLQQSLDLGAQGALAIEPKALLAANAPPLGGWHATVAAARGAAACAAAHGAAACAAAGLGPTPGGCQNSRKCSGFLR